MLPLTDPGCRVRPAAAGFAGIPDDCDATWAPVPRPYLPAMDRLGVRWGGAPDFPRGTCTCLLPPRCVRGADHSTCAAEGRSSTWPSATRRVRSSS